VPEASLSNTRPNLKVGQGQKVLIVETRQHTSAKLLMKLTDYSSRSELRGHICSKMGESDVTSRVMDFTLPLNLTQQPDATYNARRWRCHARRNSSRRVHRFYAAKIGPLLERCSEMWSGSAQELAIVIHSAVRQHSSRTSIQTSQTH